MTRTVVKTDIHLEVYPINVNTFFTRNLTPGEIAEKEERLIDAIKDAILRHVDDVGGVFVQYTPVTYCGYHSWQADSDGDSRGQFPGCCDNDQKEFYTKHRSESDEWFHSVGLDDTDQLRSYREDATLNQ